jgi:hypothetical protein
MLVIAPSARAFGNCVKPATFFRYWRWEVVMAKTTTDHETIRKWAKARGGKPARVKGTGDVNDPGLLRLDFGEPEEGLEAISWEEFFDKFEESNLALLYQDEPDNRFNKLVGR